MWGRVEASTVLFELTGYVGVGVWFLGDISGWLVTWRSSCWCGSARSGAGLLLCV
jgi:hypothetical protein